MTDAFDFFAAALGNAPLRLLEIGAGDGTLSRRLAAAGHSVTALDVDGARLPEIDGVQRVVADFAAWHHPLGAFDAVVVSQTLHHLPAEKAIARIAALLAPGGRIAVDETCWDWVDRRTAAWYAKKRAEHLGEPEVAAPAAHRTWFEANAEHVPGRVMLEFLYARFKRAAFEKVPMLHGEFGEKAAAVLPEEEAAIAAGEIEPTGLRWAGVKR